MTKDVVIRIDRTTREKLERMRDRTQLGSYDAVILWLMGDLKVPLRRKRVNEM